MINSTVARIESGGWDFSWPAGTGPYSVWLDGRRLAVVTDPAYTFLLPGYDLIPPDLEILDVGGTPDNFVYPPYVLLQWRGLQSAVNYIIEQYTGDSTTPWVLLGSLRELKRGYYAWTTAPIPDEEDVQFRVTAADLVGNPGTHREFAAQVCCNPRRPAVAFSVTSSGDIHVSEA